MVVESKRTRVGAAAAQQARHRSLASNDSHILLARGLSARSTGSNVPLTTLTQDEMERDLRHMEAFQNACTTYAQQFYIFTNQTKLHQQAQDSKKPMPAFSRTPLPVRIDPDEEKRLLLLRQKIQTCEAQREVYEGQYLSLRAHYIFLSQELRDKREDVTSRITFLQDQVVKRGRVVALQRVRLQVLRETLQCLLYRRNGGTPIEDEPEKKEETKDADGDVTMKTDEGEGEDGTDGKDDSATSLEDLQEVWNEIEAELKKAEDDLKSTGGQQVLDWTASKIPKIPPGVPLLLSQLADQPGQAAAWNTGGAFGSKPDSLLWIHNQVPTGPPDTADELPALRKQVADLQADIDNEKAMSSQHKNDMIQCRTKNDELVAMMALIRTEMEAVVARHNIVLESDEAKQAKDKMNGKGSKGGRASKSRSLSTSTDTKSSVVQSTDRLKEDDENDGDDEGAAEEAEEDYDADSSRPKRGLETESEISTRPKRRKV